MRKIVFVVLSVLLLFPAVLCAQTKIGVINMEAVAKKSEPGREAMKKLQAEFKEMKAELDERKTEIEKLRDALQKQGLVLSREAKLDKELEYKRKVRDFQDLLQSFQRKTKAEEARLTQPIIQMMIKVIQDYGKKNGYTVIVDGKAGGLLYANDTVDITNKIIVELNKAWRSRGKTKTKSGK